MGSHSIWPVRIKLLFHGLLHFSLGDILLEITNFIPANCHDSFFATFIPDTGTLTGGINPVVGSLDILVCHCSTFWFALCLRLLLTNFPSFTFFRITPRF